MNGSDAPQQLRPLPGGISRAQLATDRDDIQMRIARVLIVVAEPDAAVRAPIVVLQGDKHNPYSVIEKHMTPEVLIGCERLWRLARSLHTPALDTWRPRVNGDQSKALSGVRLPDRLAEWDAVRAALEALGPAFRPDSGPAALLTDLMTLADECAAWWDMRPKPTSGSKRPPPRPSSVGGPAHKRQQVASRSQSPSPVCRPPSLPDILAHYQQPSFFGMGAGVWQQPTPFGAVPPLPGLLNPQPALSGGMLNGTAMSRNDSGSGLVGGTPALGMQRHDSSNSGHSMQQQHAYDQQPHTPPSQVVVSPTVPPQTGGPPHSSGADFALPSAGGRRVKQTQVSQNGGQPSPPTSSPPAAGQQQQVEAILRELEQRVISLNVGGVCVATTAATLAAVEGSFLSKLVFIQPAPQPQRAQTADFFIDRNGKLFEHVLAYLRAVQYQEAAPDLPDTSRELGLLLREAKYYALPGLEQRIQEALDHCPAQQPSRRLTVDVHIDDRGRGTVSSCRWDGELPAHGFAGGAPLPADIHLRQSQRHPRLGGAHSGF